MDAVEIFAENSSTQDIAGSRIASFIFVKTWYKTCNKAKQLQSELTRSSDECQNAKQNLEIKKFDYYEKQKEIEDLTCQLRFTQKEVYDLMLMVDELEMKVKMLKDNKQNLITQFSARCEECISINQQISELKHKLAKNLENKQELEIQLETSKLKAESVSEKSELLDEEFAKLKTEGEECENNLLQQLGDVEDEIRKAKNERTELKSTLKELKEFTKEYENIQTKIPGPYVEMEKTLLSHEAAILRDALEKTFENKFRKHTWTIGKYILKGFELLLPALPKSNI